MSVLLGDLKVGGLLAEGGEGRVHVLPRQPHLVLKSYRRPADRSHLEDLVAWPDRLPASAASVLRAAAAWPCSVVAGGDGRAEGLLMPRAPRRFAVRHRDGHSRLASLSYLTADPGHRAAAYGLQLPAPASPERVGLAYALARLLAAFESVDPSVGHGDLSTKNVLWSLQRGPEVFVIDCDNCDLYGPDGHPVQDAGRRRAMTPNWDDPSVPRGSNPIAGTDRYSLALIFLRVVGAANFPIQARQRKGEPVEVRFSVPAGSGSDILLDPSATVWQLCTAGLAAGPAAPRPPASAWLQPLEQLLEGMGAAAVMEAVWRAQGADGRSPGRPFETGPAQVAIIPERVTGQARTWAKVAPSPRYGGPPPAPIGYRRAPGAALAAAPPAGPALRQEVTVLLQRFLRWWLGLHRNRRPRRWMVCLAVDLSLLVAGAAAVALAVSLILGR